MHKYLLFLPAMCLALLLIFRAWDGFCRFIGAESPTRRNVMASSFSVILLFCVGFRLQLSGNKTGIDIGYFLTELTFLRSYLLIGFAALLGQAKYHRS